MKSFLAFISVAMITIFCFCGCGSSTQTGETAAAGTKGGEALTEKGTIPFYTKEIKDDPSDPYADYAKEICGDIVDGWQDWNTNDFELYFKGKNYTYYSFYDLNGDGTDEMLLGEWVKVGDYTDDPNPPRKLKLSAVCAIKNGEIKRSDCDSLFWSEFIYDRVVLSNGIIMTTWGYPDFPNYVFYYFDGISLRLKYMITFSKISNGYSVISEDETESEIDKRAFIRLRDEAIGDATPVEIEWKRIDEYGQ